MRQILLLSCFMTGILQAAEEAWNFDAVRKTAYELSKQPYDYDPNHADLPESLKQLNYDEYRTINYRHEKAVWAREDIPFTIEFFHRGYLFEDRVDIYLVENKKTRKLKFSPDLFRYGKNKPADIDADSGFAGLRIIYHKTGMKTLPKEIISFLGASYFRAVPFGGVYGASARGVAINTAVSDADEEFPAFRTFWIKRPKSGADMITLYALLDGASITGAYSFEIIAGKEIVMRVGASLFLREDVKALGIAPLTSMFYYDEGKNSGPATKNHRPEVHDSDGLLLLTGSGEWVWRPLHNPEEILCSSFGADGRLQGFGLLQRDRRSEHYYDPITSPQLRPSIWVEPIGKWPAGHVELLELPTNREGMDNIVAQYVLESLPEIGEEMRLIYRLRFYSHENQFHRLARVTQTTRERNSDGMEYVIEFSKKQLGNAGDVKPRVTSIGGKIKDVNLHKCGDAYRLNLQVMPKDQSHIVEIRASLIQGNQTVSEIWSDQWKL